MADVEGLLGRFMDDWNAGRRPDVDAFVAAALDAGAREELLGLLDGVRECLARMRSEDMRVVMQQTMDGADVEAIMAERGLSRDNVYQLRSRALRQIRKEVLGDG